MKAIVSRTDLHAALDRVSRIAKPGRHPVLETLVLRASRDALTIDATDLDIEVRVACSAYADVPGAATVPAEAFAKLVKRLPDGDVGIELLDDRRVRVKAKRSQVHFPSLLPDDMPLFLDQAGTYRFEVPGQDFARLLGVAFAAPDDVSQQYLCGVCLHSDAEDMHLCSVATDTHVLARASISMPIGAKGIPRIIIGLTAADEISKLCSLAASNPVQVEVSTHRIEVAALGARIRSKLLEGRYPDYERVIPDGNARRLDIACSEIAQAFGRALVITTDKGSGVRCEIADGAMSISTRGAAGAEIVDEVDVDFAGHHTFSFSAKLASRVIDALGSETAIVEVREAHQGTIWRNASGEMFCLLMPMRG